nr:SH3 domain-containing protein [bacterium]
MSPTTNSAPRRSPPKKSGSPLAVPLLIIGVIVLGIALPFVLPLDKLFQPHPTATATPPQVIITPPPSGGDTTPDVQVTPTPDPDATPTNEVPQDTTPTPGTSPEIQLPADAWNAADSALRIRSGAGVQYSEVGQIPVGAKLRVLVMGEWAQVVYDNKSGYVASQFLTFTDPSGSVQKGSDAWNKSDSSLRLRASGSTSAEVLANIPSKGKVTVLEWGTWAKVQYEGKTGYVSSEYLTTTNPN